ncbi:MAG: MlaD family protein [Francisellaceae bacterium]
MKNNRYFIAGLFILLITSIMIILGFWMAFGLKEVKYDTYIARFNESVDGLYVNANVNYNGVPVGKVENIRIDKKNPSIVIVTLQIEEGTPILSNTYASLQPQGITGQVYVSLSLQSDRPSRLIPPKSSPPYPDIATKPSLFSNIISQISLVADEINQIANRTNKLINDKNIAHIDQVIDNIDTISKTLADNGQSIDNSLKYLTILLKNSADSSQQLNQIMLDIKKSAGAVSDAALNIEHITTSVKDQTLQGINNLLLPAMSQSFQNINTVAIELNTLLKTLNDNPSILIRGTTPPKPKTGERQ